MCRLNNLSFTLDKVLNIPPLAASYIKCTAINKTLDKKENNYTPSNLPLENGPIIYPTVTSARILSEGEDVKTAIELILDISEYSLDYLPGDTIGVLPQNPDEDTRFLLERLDVNENTILKIEVDKDAPKKKAGLPPYIPNLASGQFIFQECLDLRAVVKKVFLRTLVNFTSDENEKRRLKELCSREGSGEYNDVIINSRSSIIDILKAFPSCKPSIPILLEHLPRLQPRPYSIASSPLESRDKIRIVFNVIFDSRNRRGVCSGWLHDITRSFHDISYKLKMLNFDIEIPSIKIPIYLRKTTTFRIPENPSVPLIMIGPGTGVAPFIGFLEHRRKQLLQENRELNDWLFFGCRYPGKDELFKDTLRMYEKEDLCKYVVCYSRTEKHTNDPKYVQDIILQKQDEIIGQILSSETCIFICGNGIDMAKNILETLVTCFKNVQGISEEEAEKKVADLESNHRISKDLWL